jgi:hypothetical protein
MPFIKAIMAKAICRWSGLVCSVCGHKFENGEPVYSHFKGAKRIVGHLCKKCYDAKYLDL